MRQRIFILAILLLLQLIGQSQIINRSKSVEFSGTAAISLYSGTTAQRPTGDRRFIRWNSDSGRFEGKINSTTWLKFLMTGDAAGGGGGITSLNSLTGATQTFATGTSGTDFAISSSGTTHTFNIPTASASNRGLLSTTDWSAFNGKLSASDTVGKWWGVNGNTIGATKNFGSLDNNHIQFVANGSIVGGLASNGEFRFGTNTDRGAYPVQLNGRTIVFSPAGNAEFQVEDDGANSSNATSVFNIASNSLPTMLLTTPSNVNTLLIRDYGQTTNLFTIGADNNVALTHVLTDNATSGKKWAYGAINTFNPTSGGGSRDAFIDSSTINQTGGASGPYNSFHSILTKTACANCAGVWIENSDSWFGSTSGSLAVGIARTTAPTARLHLGAGTATASTAPLKFTSGTNLGTAEAGAMEYNGTSLFFSPSTTRLRTVLTDNSIPSNGQIPIGNGTNYTNANITSTGGTVTVTNGAGTINLDLSSDIGMWTTATIQTTNNTPTDIATIPIATGTTYMVAADIVAIQSSGTGAYGSQKTRLFHRESGGTLDQNGVGSIIADTYLGAGLSTATATITNSGATAIVIQVTGETGVTINWKVRYRITNL